MNEKELLPVENQELVDGGVMNNAEQATNVESQEQEEIIAEEDLIEEIEPIDCTLLTREELIDKLSEMLQYDDLEAIKSNVAAIKTSFIEKTKAEKGYAVDEEATEEETSEEKEEDPLEIKFNQVFSIYKQKRAKYLEQLEEQKKANLEAKQEILEQMRVLVNSEEALKATYDQFRMLQDKWKEIGAVPKLEVNNLWQNYHFLVEKFFDKVKISRELRDLDMKKNLEAKIELCEKVEELLLEKSIKKSFTKLQEYRQEWKNIGLVPSDKKDELWERFRTAADKINAQRKEYYQVLRDQQDSNYAAKSAIIEQAEKLMETKPTTIKGWQENAEQFDELFKVWRTIGPAGKVQNEEIWAKFRGIIDSFYAARKEFHVAHKEQMQTNYNYKLEICVQAEALKDSDDWAATTNALIKLQNDWKNIGPVQKKLADKLWKRFRAACDEFFNRKEQHFSTINEASEENLNKKRDIIERIKNLEINEENIQGSLSELKKLQREWMEVGHVPRKLKDTIQKEYRAAVDEKLEIMKKIDADIDRYNFKNKIDQYKDQPNAKNLINKERNVIYGRIQSMKEDVALWENNIGFLSNSKNSNLLKDEFERKINRTKQEIALLEAKLRVIDEQ